MGMRITHLLTSLSSNPYSWGQGLTSNLQKPTGSQGCLVGTDWCNAWQALPKSLALYEQADDITASFIAVPFNPSSSLWTMFRPDPTPRLATRHEAATSIQILWHFSFLVHSACSNLRGNTCVLSREPGQLTDGLIRDHTVHSKADNKAKARSLRKMDLAWQGYF